VTAVLDTSVLVRYLTLDPPTQGAVAQALIDGQDALLVTSVALAETGFALTRLYGVERAAAVDLLIELMGRTNLTVLDLSKARVVEALTLCRPSARVSFADALIWAAARNAGANVIYTFDQRFPAAGLERRVLTDDGAS
jgi:predicted nucleic acid-binding protein